MEFGDVASLDFVHLAAADPWVDEELDRSPVFVGRARLAVGGDKLVEKALPEGLHGRGLAVGIPLCGRVAAALGLGEQGHRAPPRVFGREGRHRSECHAAELAVGAELGDEELAAGRPDAQAETGQLLVPVEAVRTVALDPVDGALGDLDLCRHGVARFSLVCGEHPTALGITWKSLGIKIVVSARLGLSTKEGLVRSVNLLSNIANVEVWRPGEKGCQDVSMNTQANSLPEGCRFNSYLRSPPTRPPHELRVRPGEIDSR